MSVFGNLTTDGLEKTEDRLGGFTVKPTDAYLSEIKAAYAIKSQGGAQGVVLILNLDGGEYNETVYVTNRNGENWFPNRNDKTKKVPLPGFTTINDICLVTTGKPLSEQDTEEKVVKVYDFNEGKELPKTVPMLVDLIGQKFWAGIVQQTVDKNQKNESTGEYEPTGETRDENVIEKVFHEPTKMTVVEATEGATEPVFFDKWVEKNKGVVRNRAKGANSDTKSGRPGGAGAPQSGAAGSGKKTTSLFGK